MTIMSRSVDNSHFENQKLVNNDEFPFYFLFLAFISFHFHVAAA